MAGLGFSDKLKHKATKQANTVLWIRKAKITQKPKFSQRF